MFGIIISIFGFVFGFVVFNKCVHVCLKQHSINVCFFPWGRKRVKPGFYKSVAILITTKKLKRNSSSLRWGSASVYIVLMGVVS